MKNNINDLYQEILKLEENINNQIFEFITQASKLVELSEDIYQLEPTIKLNKISIKDYILNSPCCKILEQNNISNYSIKELKQYLLKYEQSNNEPCFPYQYALNMYELLEEIEKNIDNKIDLELNKVSEIYPIILSIKTINKQEYQQLYNQITSQITTNNQEQQITMKLINDIFNYYINGYPNLPI